MHDAAWVCDVCGDRMKDKDEVSAVAVQVCAKIQPPKVQPPDARDFWGLLGGGTRPRLEEFHFCPECIMALLIGLKLKRTKVGAVPQ